MDDASPSAASAKRPPISVLQIVSVQILLLILGGMVMDGGGLAIFLAASIVPSWIYGGVVALRGRSSVQRALLWSWLTAAVILVALGAVSGFRCMGGNPPRRSWIGNNERQIVLGCLAYSSEDPRKVWPPDMPTLIRWSEGDIPEKLMQVTWRPELPQPIIYIRPIPTAPSNQPVLLSDPVCDRQGMTVVCYADGHIKHIGGKDVAKTLWEEARRLADMPRVLAEGARPEDWTSPAALDR